jgi:hypothetical protein
MSVCLPFQARLRLCSPPLPPKQATLLRRVQHFL